MKIYLLAGCTPHQHPYDFYSKELPTLRDCTVKLMSHFLHTVTHSAISGLLHVQMLAIVVLIKLHRIQAGDRQHQLPVGPSCAHKFFPMYHYTALQHVQKMVN